MARQTPADSRSMIRFIIVSETRYREGWYKGCSASLACNEIRRDPNSKFVLRLLDSSAPAAFYRFVEIRVSQWTTNRISQWSLSRRIRWRNPSVLSYASATLDARRVIFPGRYKEWEYSCKLFICVCKLFICCKISCSQYFTRVFCDSSIKEICWT